MPHNKIMLFFHYPYFHVSNSAFLHSTLALSFYIDVVLTLSYRCLLTEHSYDPTIVHNVVIAWIWIYHNNDVIMGKIASQITSLTIIYSIVYPDADQKKHQSSASLAFVWGFHRGPVNSPLKWPVTRNFFPFDDVIMYKYSVYMWTKFVLGVLPQLDILLKSLIYQIFALASSLSFITVYQCI